MTFSGERLCPICRERPIRRRKVFKGKKNGPIPRYCSGACRVKAYRIRNKRLTM